MSQPYTDSQLIAGSDQAINATPEVEGRRSSGAAGVSIYEFGGSEEHVRAIQKFFLQYFRGRSLVADLGCGRGIFLDLLREEGIQGVGVDSSEESFQACCTKKLEVFHQTDIFAFLADRKQQFDGIFCSHVIEHLAYEDGVRLMELCYQALRPNGRLLIVTPNSNDLAVSGEIFWLDPTHIRLYPLPLLQRMAMSIGFDSVAGASVLGSWRAIPKRQVISFFMRRLLWGRFFGRPNTYLVADKRSY
jgi:SAM-dependent methyltransferase